MAKPITPSELHIPTLRFVLNYLEGERSCYGLNKFADVRDDGTVDECADANAAWRQTMDGLIDWMKLTTRLAIESQE